MDTEAVQHFDLRSHHVLPNYIQGPPDHLTEASVNCLGIKDAMSIPDISLRNEILKGYIQFVHPCLPILDLEEFLNTIFQSNGASRISLLLFQAVLAAG